MVIERLSDFWQAWSARISVATTAAVVFIWLVRLYDSSQALRVEVDYMNEHGSREVQLLESRVETLSMRVHTLEQSQIVANAAINELNRRVDVINERQQQVIQRLHDLEQHQR